MKPQNIEKEFVISKKALLGNIANWSVQQSPYHRPENLEIVLDSFDYEIREKKDYFHASYDELIRILDVGLKKIPEFLKWNERKNGNQNEYKFVSRYSTNENPDDDFIDLDALIRNVANSIVGDAYLVEEKFSASNDRFDEKDITNIKLD